MKLQLYVIGKSDDRLIEEAVERYLKRLRHYVPFECVTVPDVKLGRSSSEDRLRQAEGAALLSSLVPRDFVILLDERGKELTSREFAAYIDKRMANAAGNIVFVIGGPYGFSQEVYDRADDKLSLSRMTLTHEMVRLMFVEQVYRAMTILRGEPYHHD